jgi:hypothetical protein
MVTIEVETVGGTAVAIPSSGVKTVTVETTGGKLSVAGQVLPVGKNVLACTLIRLGQDIANESIRSTTRFCHATPASANWSVQFEGVDKKGVYILACHCSDSNDYVEVTVDGVSTAMVLSRNVDFSSPAPSFTAASITANGTVQNASNPVVCTVTPINPDGTTRLPGVGEPPNQPPQFATFVGLTDWTVTFTAPLGKSYKGMYLLSAGAANEGTVSTTGEV